MGIQMLKLHWKAAKWPMLPVLIAAFGLPWMAGQAAWAASDSPTLSAGYWYMVTSAGSTGILMPFLAMAAGSIVALTAWNPDHKHDHIYPLSLPIARWKYSTLKYASGAIIMLGTGAIFFAGAATVTAGMQLPVGLSAYPVELSGKFVVAGLTSYSLLFALAAGTMRSALLVISSVAFLLLFGNILVGFAETVVPAMQVLELDVSGDFLELLTEGPGPLRVFSGSWSLIDV